MEEDFFKNLASLPTNHNPNRPTKSIHDFFSKPDDPITGHHHHRQRSNSNPTVIDSLRASPDSSPAALSLSSASSSDHYFQPFRTLPDTASGSLGPASPSPFKHLGRRRPVKSGFYCKKAESFNDRLVKNRESAARSRSRKQAQAVELENELHEVEEKKAILLEELQKLKKELETFETFEAREPELEKQRSTLERSLTL